MKFFKILSNSFLKSNWLRDHLGLTVNRFTPNISVNMVVNHSLICYVMSLTENTNGYHEKSLS